jgi:two-component system sensor histidine kinase/response regulator
LLEWIPAGERAPIEATDGPEPEQASTSADAVDQLSTVPGLDVEGGLKRVMGKRDFYEKLIRGFLDGDESRSVITIREQLLGDDSGSAERTAHSLKGVAGTLGAGKLQELAQDLESAIGNGHSQPDIDSHLGTVQSELDRLLGSIKDVLVAPESEPANEEHTFDATQITDLAHLIEAMDSHTDRAAELSSTLTINDIEDFASEMRTLGSKHGFKPLEEWANELTDAAGMFDTDSLSETLAGYTDLIDRLSDTA